MSNVKIILLKNGKNIIAELIEDENMPGAIVVKCPIEVVLIPQQNNVGLAFFPFLDFSEEFDKGIVFSPNDIYTIVTPKTELYNRYNEIFGSGIQIASATPDNIMPFKK